jgi:uncharacterized protein YjbJ (UPF0337 family)
MSLKDESMKQQVKGAAEKTKGQMKEAAGDLTGRDDWAAEGEMDQAEGDARTKMGRAGEKLSDAADKLKD